MLVSTLDSTMRLVGTEQGEVARVYRGHTNKLYCSMNTFVMTLPHEQQAVASGSEDGSIWLWDLNSRHVRGVFNRLIAAHTAVGAHSAHILFSLDCRRARLCCAWGCSAISWA
jgi:WD40 repeat protein